LWILRNKSNNWIEIQTLKLSAWVPQSHIWLNDDNASDDIFSKRRIQNSEK
jgi:hypothetical protein